jgi:hypothetical protein
MIAAPIPTPTPMPMVAPWLRPPSALAATAEALGLPSRAVACAAVGAGVDRAAVAGTFVSWTIAVGTSDARVTCVKIPGPLRSEL